jgi:hypothetical protein
MDMGKSRGKLGFKGKFNRKFIHKLAKNKNPTNRSLFHTSLKP